MKADTDPLAGYRGLARRRLEEWGVKVWSEVRLVNQAGSVLEGVIVPRGDNLDDLHLVLKLRNGYTVGVHVDRATSADDLGHQQPACPESEQERPIRSDLPKITLLATCGTIASRLVPRTGALIPAFTPDELYAAIPELADICRLKTSRLFHTSAEDMGWHEYATLARSIGEEIDTGADGVVIEHGADTVGNAAAVLSFMVQSSPVPIVLVGGHGGSNRPSNRAALNLVHALRAAAQGNIAEVQICAFGPSSDDYGLLHRGTRCRKMHSTSFDTFRTVGDIPLAVVSGDRFTVVDSDFLRRDSSRQVKIDPVYSDRVTILYYYPGMKPDLVDALVAKGYRGIVIAGTGLGHVNAHIQPALKRAIERGTHVVMTVQSLWGHTQMKVHESGRNLLDIGVVPLGNMLPETALMKLGWVLGHTRDHLEVRRMMREPINHEMTPREPHNGFLVLQGGLPER